MLPYELILPSASRPHLLRQTLSTFFANAGQWPERVIVHNDGVFPGKREQIETLLYSQVPGQIPLIFQHDESPLRHGPSLKWLLANVRTEYVLYTQDDFATVRPLPIDLALGVMHRNGLNQIRFNKRKTMAVKGEPGREFVKVEKIFPALEEFGAGVFQTLCVADHWYFQTGVWRVAAIKPVVDWWASIGPGAFSEHCETKINQVFNGHYRSIADFPPSVPVCSPEDWNDPVVRGRVHKTFIFGGVREPKFVEHLGHDPKDWALVRANRGERSD